MNKLPIGCFDASLISTVAFCTLVDTVVCWQLAAWTLPVYVFKHTVLVRFSPVLNNSLPLQWAGSAVDICAWMYVGLDVHGGGLRWVMQCLNME